MAAVAELEAGLISQRIKAALAEAKRRGKKLGGFRGYRGDTQRATAKRVATATAQSADLGPIITPLRQAGLSLRQIGQDLTARGIVSPRGGAWTAEAVRQVMRRQSAAESGCASTLRSRLVRRSSARSQPSSSASSHASARSSIPNSARNERTLTNHRWQTSRHPLSRMSAIPSLQTAARLVGN